MINAIIIDDELHSHESLKWKLDSIDIAISVPACFDKPKEALEYLKSNKVDLVFLDIDMPGMNGIQLLESLNEIDFSIIFTTAHDAYAINAIKLSALDYLLKPIDISELKSALQKHITMRKSVGDNHVIRSFINNYKTNHSGERIALSTRESIEFVEVQKIIYCSSESNYTKVFLDDATVRLLAKTLKDIEEQLIELRFFRSHNSYLVNVNHIKEIKKKEGGSLLMTDGTSIPLSRGKRDDLLRMM